MSFDASLWAMKDAPVANVEEWAVAVCMGEVADDDGCNAFLSTKTIAERTRLSERTVQRRIDDMVGRGMLALGDQNESRLLKIPPHLRPTNYDMRIPYGWFGSIERVDRDRAKRGLGPLNPADRPPLPPAPPKKQRADLGKPKPRKEAQEGSKEAPIATPDDFKTPGDYKTPGDSQTSAADYQSPQGVSSSHPNLSLTPTQEPTQKENDSLRSSPPDDDPVDAVPAPGSFEDGHDAADGTPSTTAAEAPADVKPDLKIVDPDGSKRDTKRGHRLPEDWLPSEDVQAWTLKECPLVRKADLEEFRDYWHSEAGAKARKVDWDLTWKNRCRVIQARKAKEAEREQRWASGGRAPTNAHRPQDDASLANRRKWSRGTVADQ